LVTPSQAYECVALGSALSLGALLEPLAHPKPGAVTRVQGQADKGIFDFALHHEAVERGAIRACVSAAEGSEDPIADGLEAYLEALEELGLRTNVGLGQALLIVPLAAASPGRPGVRALCERASELVRRSTPRASAAYYRALAALAPSHLGRYRGPLPDVSQGAPSVGLGEVLGLVDDLVSQEAVNGYRLTLRAYELMRGRLTEGVEEAISGAFLWLASSTPDSLLARSRGARASLIAMAEASLLGAEELDRAWRSRGWNLGSLLDIVAAAASLISYELHVKLKGGN